MKPCVEYYIIIIIMLLMCLFTALVLTDLIMEDACINLSVTADMVFLYKELNFIYNYLSFL